LKAANDDDYKIKKMEEQIAETAQMLPNAKTRLEAALEDLKNFLGDNESSEELVASEDWKAAEAVLAEATAFIETI
jgi:hypothetical protein